MIQATIPEGDDLLMMVIVCLLWRWLTGVGVFEWWCGGDDEESFLLAQQPEGEEEEEEEEEGFFC